MRVVSTKEGNVDAVKLESSLRVIPQIKAIATKLLIINTPSTAADAELLREGLARLKAGLEDLAS